VIRKNYPVAIGNRVMSGERETASVVGPLCTPLDLLADRMELAARPTSATWWSCSSPAPTA
jgi:diaminopimelate decarboxylase